MSDPKHGHDPYCEELSAYLDGELSTEERARVEDHLATCDDCRHLCDDLGALVRCCAEQPPPPGVSQDIHKGLMARLGEELGFHREEPGK